MEMKRSKYLLAALTVICILLIIVTSIKDGIMEPLRTGVGYVLVPLQTGVNAVGKGIYTELRDYSMLKDALAENERMKEEITGMEWPLHCSVGITARISSKDDFEALFNRADNVMYVAKQTGRNRYFVDRRHMPRAVRQVDRPEWQRNQETEGEGES